MSEDAAVRAAIEAIQGVALLVLTNDGQAADEIGAKLARAAVEAARPIIVEQVASYLDSMADERDAGNVGNAANVPVSCYYRLVADDVRESPAKGAAVRTEPEQDEPFWWNDPIAGAARGSEGREPERERGFAAETPNYTAGNMPSGGTEPEDAPAVAATSRGGARKART